MDLYIGLCRRGDFKAFRGLPVGGLYLWDKTALERLSEGFPGASLYDSIQNRNGERHGQTVSHSVGE